MHMMNLTEADRGANSAGVIGEGGGVAALQRESLQPCGKVLQAFAGVVLSARVGRLARPGLTDACLLARVVLLVGELRYWPILARLFTKVVEGGRLLNARL